ncbi:hypothetical protein GCK32_012029 [Trichostrongylus colubriformis]|uniref:Uncharacterized protein n=1 Tax=Trichostrongylus colubriformis TaxID=6319 RepID=A0AAN8F680_TRICO
MMSLIMPFTQEQLQYRNWLKSFVLEYKEPELPPSTVVCNTLLAPSIDLAKCALQQYIMSLPRSSRPLEIVDPRDLERMSTTAAATSPSHENGGEMTCTSSSASDSAGPVVSRPIDDIDRSTTASVKSDSSEAVIEKVGKRSNGFNGNAKNGEEVAAKEEHKNGEKPATLAAIVAGAASRSKSKQMIDDMDKQNGNVAVARKDRTPSPSENKTPPLAKTKPSQPVTNHVPPSSHGRVFHNQQYYKAERASSASRDSGSSSRGTRPLVPGGNGMRRKPVANHSPNGTASPAPHPPTGFMNGTMRSSRTGPASRKAHPTTYYKRNGERGQATRRDTTPRLASDDGGESSERDSVKNDGYQTVRSRNRPRHK